MAFKALKDYPTMLYEVLKTDNMSEIIKDALTAGNMVTCGTWPNFLSKNITTDEGLLYLHAYSILGSYTTTQNDIVLHLRDPLGSKSPYEGHRYLASDFYNTTWVKIPEYAQTYSEGNFLISFKDLKLMA